MVCDLTEWCCQTNANQSLLDRESCQLMPHKAAPLGQSGGAVELEIVLVL